MNLSQLAKAIGIIKPNHSILIYGQPGTGKTRLAGTAAKIKAVHRIFWFDLENGVQTLLGMGLTEEELEKVILIKIADTRDSPIAIETMLKALTSKVATSICELHGRVNCAACAKESQPSIKFLLSDLTHNDLIVIDSGSQLGDSALAAACLGKPDMFKPTFDEYGMVNKWLGDCMSVIQQCSNTNFVVITHEIALEDDEGKDKFFPLIGSKAFSMKAAKYFGTRVYMHKKLNKHVGGSSSTYRGDVLAASRVNAKLEDAKELTMDAILVATGILKEDGSEMQKPALVPVLSVVPATVESAIAALETATNKPLTLKERLALKNQKK